MDNSTYKLGLRAIHQKDIQAAIIEAKRNKFAVLEIHLSSPQFLPQQYSADQLIKLKAFAQKNFIILQTHSAIGQSLIQADNILRAAEKQQLDQIIKFSTRIGARCLTLHIGYAPGYNLGPGKHISNDVVYAKHYSELFEDSIKYIISIAPKSLYICIENDNLLPEYQKVLDKYLRTSKVFLTWDIMKNYSFQPIKKLHGDQWKFLNKHINSVRNIHISGPKHAGIQGCEKDFARFFKLFKNRNIPMVVEVVSLKEAIRTKKIIKYLGF